MNVSITKKLEQLEKRFIVRNLPSLIMITYKAGENVYIVKETYNKFDGRLNVTGGGNIRQRKINSLQEYIIPGEYTANMIFDFMERDPAIMTTLSLAELRKTAKIGKSPFVFVDITPADHEKEVQAEIGLIEEKKGK